MVGDTLPRVFWSRVETSGGLPAQMVKRDGQWRTLAWSEVGEIVRELALGLLALGRQKGEAVALLSASRPEWVQADWAILSVACVTVPIYATYTPELIAYIVNDSDARTLIVENPAQLRKAWDVRAKLRCLDRIVVIEGSGGEDPSVLTWDELRHLGRDSAGRLQGVLAERVASIRPEDVATVVYTSGTTGPPKGVVQTHRNHLATCDATAQVTQVKPGDVHLLFLPLAHAFARLESFMGAYAGLTTAFAESPGKVAQDIRQVCPHFFCSVPRLFEKIYAAIHAGVEAASPLRKRIFFWALGVGRTVSRLKQARQTIPRTLRLKHRLARRLVFGKLHQALGGRLRFAVSGGAPLSREIAEFFHAAGVLILEGYGLTETCPVLTFNRIDRFKLGSVGRALPGVELKIASDGEILARGPNIAVRGYLNQPDATAEAFMPDGWFHTGDIGRLDDEEFLYITDRKKDLIVTSTGSNIAPQKIENLLRSDPFISQAMVYGDRCPYAVALISVNPEELPAFAKAQAIGITDYADLTKHPKVVEHVARIVQTKNAELAPHERIRRFAVVPVEFTETGGELTPTQKVKRAVVAEQYGELIGSLYH
jgi:long-chain acyl-CoA synthetase